MSLKLNMNPSRRNFLKFSTASVVAVALVGISPSTIQAKENKSKADGEPPKLSKAKLKNIAKKSGLSIKKIQALEKTINKMMDHNKFSDWHPDNTDYRLHGGMWYRKDGKMMSPYDVDSALTYNEFGAMETLSRRHSYINRYYHEDLPELFSRPELKKVKDAYEVFMNQVDHTYKMLNRGKFLNHEEDEPVSDVNKVRTSYDRVVAMGILEGWSPEEFRVALEEIFPAKLKAQGLSLEDAWSSDHGRFPARLLKEKHAFFYDKDGQQENITAFNEFIRDNEIREEGYDGQDSPLVRAKKLYPNDKLRQIIYAFNIVVAFQIRKTKEQLEKGDTSYLNSIIPQEMWAVFNALFYPSH